MAIVIVADQRNSSTQPDLVDAISNELNRRYEDQLALPLVRTAGDEMQALIGEADALASLAADLLEDHGWWVGIGLGTVNRRGATSRDSAGPAFQAARIAIEAAKHDRRSPGRLAVRGRPEQLAAWLQAALGALDYIRNGRTARQREVVHAVATSPSAKAAAERLGVSPQTVSQTLAAAGYGPEAQLVTMINDLAAQAIAD